MKKYKFIILASFLFISIISCDDYLALKPDKKMVVPTTGRDLRGLLNRVSIMNFYAPSGLGEFVSDDLWFSKENWESLLFEDERLAYIWERVPVTVSYWEYPYQKIMYANHVIDLIDQVVHDNMEDRNQILGSALFFRGWNFFEVCQFFSPAYDSETAEAKKGIVLRLSSDINQKSERSSMQESYSQIIKDLTRATELLGAHKPEYPTTPYKASAFAMLSRVYLSMRDYKKAALYADSSLQLQSELLDYNKVVSKPYPFERFNQEVLFFSNLYAGSALTEARARVNPTLIDAYSSSDLRKSLYFTLKNDNCYAFVGDYSQLATSNKFGGLTTAEMYLTRAEANVRNGNIQGGLRDLNYFMSKRYKNTEFQELESTDKMAILEAILLERRKELLFRGLRWLDIRRLSFDPGAEMFEITRSIGGRNYVFTATDIRDFTFMIPQLVIDRSDIEQN